jgi:hypothetical protein
MGPIRALSTKELDVRDDAAVEALAGRVETISRRSVDPQRSNKGDTL